VYPNWDWSSTEVYDYFNNRFGGGDKNWIISGTKSLQIDGTYSRATRFWAEVKKRSIELLHRDVIPGLDYALTEIVHCKSRKQMGVKQSQKQCVLCPSIFKEDFRISKSKSNSSFRSTCKKSDSKRI
jgi:hypothetical protein